MKRIKRIFAAFIALLILTSLATVSVFAENENSENPEESTSVVESTSSVEEQSSSSVEEQSSSSAEERSSSSEEEESSSSEEESSSSEEESSSSEEEKVSSSSSSSEEEIYKKILIHEETGVAIGLNEENDLLLLEVNPIYASDQAYADIYSRLLDATKDEELACCYEVIIGGDDTFNSKAAVFIPVDKSLIGNSMVVLFYAENGNRVKTSSKTVEGNGPEALSSGASDEETEEEPEFGYLKVSENMEAGKKYYFAVCASSVSSSGGFGLLEIMAILIGIAAVTSGGLLAFLWVRYNKKQKNGK